MIQGLVQTHYRNRLSGEEKKDEFDFDIVREKGSTDDKRYEKAGC